MKRLLVAALAITGILAAGCFVRFGSLYTADGTSHFVGFATNLSKVDVVTASVQVDFYDSSNRLLDTEFVSPCTRTLQIGKDSPFEIDARNGVVANHVQTKVQWLTLGHKTVADLDLSNVTVSTASGNTDIKGTIDVGAKDLFSVNVCAALLDANGNVVKAGSDAAGDISGDASGGFDVTVASDTNATKFELWVDAVTHSPNDVTAPFVYGPNAISAFATDTGLLSPTDNEAGDFTNPTRAFATGDDKFATVTTTTAKSEVYEGYGAKDALSSSDTITGITVRADWLVDDKSNSPKITVQLSWDGGAHWSDPINSTSASESEKTTVLGSSTDISAWGDHDWSRNELSDSNFQVKVTFSASADTKFSLDWIPVTIYFSP